MITIICGAPGAGKTALMTHFAMEYLNYDADTPLAMQRILSFNEQGYNLTIPNNLVFSDYNIAGKTMFSGYQESYFVNGFFLGMPNAQHPTMFLPPYSKVFLAEAQRYYDSRKYNSFSDFVSQLYEQHRHWGMQIYLDCQREKLIDLNIRGISTRVIYVESMLNDIDSRGLVVANHWQCREFCSADECEMYHNTHDKHIGKELEITHSNDIITFPEIVFRDTPKFSKESNFRVVKSKNAMRLASNVFDNYNSTNKSGAFLRGRKGYDFSLYAHPTDDMYIDGIDEIYTTEAPRTFYKLPDKELKEIPKGRVLTI